MYRHVNIEKILSIKYYTDVPIDTFKRFTLPANDTLMRRGDLYRLTYMSIKEQGLLDPVLCYDLVNIDLKKPPIYKRRKLFGALLLRGNIRWLVCKDLDIKYMNAIVAEMDHGHLGQCEDNLFTGTRFVYDTIKDLYTNKDLNDCYSNYNPKAIIHKNWIEMHVPSLTNVVSFNVKNTQKIVEKFNKTVKVSIINYVKNQLNKEK